MFSQDFSGSHKFSDMKKNFFIDFLRKAQHIVQMLRSMTDNTCASRWRIEPKIKKEGFMKPFYLTLCFLFLLTTSAAAVININTGSVADLTSLPGIGPVKAEAIIKYRQENGLFKKVEDLKNVYGIGEKILARIKGDITVNEDAPAAAAADVNKESKETTQTQKEPTAATSPAQE